MKALSLWQPWATLIAIGAKQIETRSWSTAYRGPLVIHAAKRMDEHAKLMENIRNSEETGWALTPYEHYAYKALTAYYGRPAYAVLPNLGEALCVVDLVEVVPVKQVAGFISTQEFALGDYSSGRFAWKLENVRPFSVPIAMRGRQGLFDCEDLTHWLEVVK